MTPFQEVLAALKRCKSMGKHHGWRPEFNKHALAPCLENYTDCLEVECSQPVGAIEFQSILGFLWHMAKRINEFCDNNKIAGDAAAEYWLECFLWRERTYNITADFSRLKGEPS